MTINHNVKVLRIFKNIQSQVKEIYTSPSLLCLVAEFNWQALR